MMVHRESRPIAFHIDAMGKFTDDKDYLREGVWWLPNDKVSDYLVLTNQGDDRMPIVLSVFDAQGRSYQKELTLLPRASNRLSVRDLAQTGHLSGEYGGIQVHALAHARALDTLHVMFDENAGFSATLKMFDHDPGALISERDFAKKGTWTIRAPMLALAQPDPALLLPAFTELEPRLLLRNTKQKPVVANVVFNWRSAASTGKTQGPAIRLKPMETRMIKLSDLASSEAPPSDAHWATVSISTDGAPDGIVAVAASYNSALTYGAQSPFSDQLSSFWKGGEWLADANHDSIITVGNASLKPMKARFTLLYSHGKARYELEQSLAPDEQMWIDVGELMRTGKPDRNGTVLPKDLTSGSYEFQDMTDRATGKLYEGKVIYDLLNGHVTYGCSVACCMIGSALTFSPLTLGLTTIATNGVQGQDNCGSGWYDISSGFYNWTTQTPSIAVTTIQGRHTGMAVGSTTSQTSGNLDRPNGRFGCLQHVVTESGPTNVYTVLVNNADITANNISVSLGGPPNAVGQLTIQIAGPGNQTTVLSQVQGYMPGNYTNGTFPRTALPVGQYGALTATWTVNGTPVSNTHPLSFYVMGQVRHTQYNSPYESACTGNQTAASITESNCTAQATTLRSDFQSQVQLNGSGFAVQWGGLQADHACSAPHTPYRDHNPVGSCGSNTGALNSSTVAVAPSGILSCGNSILLIDSNNNINATKTVTDTCPACNNSHIDDYSTVQACSSGAVGDYGTYLTIRVP